MRKSTAMSMGLLVSFLVLSSFGLSWGQPTTLIVVIGTDNNLYKMTCDDVSCSSFSPIMGRLRDAPTVTWDEKAQEWVIVGVNENNDIFMGTFNANGNFNNDWHQLQGRSPVGVGVSGMTIDTLRSLSCTVGQVAKWNGNAWACAADETGTSQQTRSFTVSGNTFTPENSSIPYSKHFCGQIWHGTSNYYRFYAPVHLPIGATITSMIVHCYDNESNGDISVNMRAQHTSCGNCQNILVSSVPSAGAVADWRTFSDTTIGHNVTDSYAYYLEAVLGGPAHYLTKVVIYYTVNTPLP